MPIRNLTRFAHALLGMLLACASVATGSAQTPSSGIIKPGDAAATGFSGVTYPPKVRPGEDPLAQTFIDFNGATLRIFDLQNMGGMAHGQLVSVPKPFIANAAQLGQVFGVALDNQVPPNIYVAASSAYGLPVVRMDSNGLLVHVRTGGPGAQFMPGLWGPPAAGGGPGSIWKIDAATGAISLFANVVPGNRANSGAALGGLAYDPDSDTLFAVDRESGLIHRFSLRGEEIGRFDHGLAGRQAAGLPPVAFDPSRWLNIADPAFDSANPDTWNYAAPERRIFGIGIRAGRLYYSVAAGLQVWSSAITPNGLADPVLELALPPGSGPSEISKITFDELGRMFLAERPASTGAFDFHELAIAGTGRVLRYQIVDRTPDGRRVWQPLPDEYAIGFPQRLQNGNGGVAIGYSYRNGGELDRGTCGGFLWSSGERLRSSADPAQAQLLARGGPFNVDGLQGNGIGLVRPANAPPLASYFIDADDRFDEAPTSGHSGDLAIWRVCGPALRGGWMWPGWLFAGWTWEAGGAPMLPPPPQLACPVDQQKPGFQCCPKGSSPDAGGQCKPWCPSGAMDSTSQKFCALGFDPATFDPQSPAKQHCLDGSAPEAGKGILGCVKLSPVLHAPVCQAGWTKQSIPNVGTICAPSPQQWQCGPGEQISPVDGKCHVMCGGTAWPAKQCCPPGSKVNAAGKCLPPAPPGKSPPPGQSGPPGGQTPPGQQGPPKILCPFGQAANASGVCQTIVCLLPSKLVGGKCCSPADMKPGGSCAKAACGPGQGIAGPGNFCCDTDKIYSDANGSPACCTGKVVNGKCNPLTGVPANPGCSPGSTDPQCCAGGYVPSGNSCCLTSQLTTTGVCCPSGQSPGGVNKSVCEVSVPGGANPPGGGAPGTGQCCLPGLIPVVGNVCCAPEQVTSTGVCCPAGQAPDPKNRRACVPQNTCGERQAMVNGSCCMVSHIYKDAGGALQCCPTLVDPAKNVCEVPQPQQMIQSPCPPGSRLLDGGTCCPLPRVSADGKSCRPAMEIDRPRPQPPAPAIVPIPERLPPRPQQLRPPPDVRPPPPPPPPPPSPPRPGPDVRPPPPVPQRLPPAKDVRPVVPQAAPPPRIAPPPTQQFRAPPQVTPRTQQCVVENGRRVCR